ncbi:MULTISPECIES: hypothetical protein [unclassified Curtobacterium]|uniref:hypothetical protein n=1 Tax=unclassified Curtobacterium TaxID=257496 RepID=UPI00111341C1|nr:MULTISPECIES: hypothetical protein [unclassified Curtobacterium]
MGGPSRRARVLATTTAITCTAILVGCSSGGGEPQGSGDGSARPAAPTSTPTPTAALTEDALRSAVLTTSELPVGGWTEKPGTSDGDGDGSGGTTSRDAESPGACAADFSEAFPDEFDDVPESGADWTRESTSSYLSVAVAADPDAAGHVRTVADAVADCPTDGATYTIDGQQQRITTVPLDLGEWGAASTCIRYELSSVTGETCMVAGDGHLVLVTVGSPYSFGVPEDTELRTIVDAAVQKAERSLT